MSQSVARFRTNHDNAATNSSPLLEAIDAAYDRIEAERDRNCWIYLRPREEALEACRKLVARARTGEHLSLLGIPFGVKDNIDVEGMPTTAACPAFSYTPWHSARSVERLTAAGAICLGKTNLDQFATGLSGARSPYGPCASVADARYVSGGSSSGSAVAVAAGHVAFALGTDTGGSGRIPAGFNNIVGIKPTVGLVSSRGLVPNCPTIDCVSVFCNTVGDGEAILDIIEGFDFEDPYSRQPRALSFASGAASSFRFGRIASADLECFGMPECGELYERACERFTAIGGTAVEVDFAPFRQAGELMFSGPWVAERHSAIASLLDIESGSLLDVTKTVLGSAGGYSAIDTFGAIHRLRRLCRDAESIFAGIDALVVPTAPRPFTLEEMFRDPITLNNRLGYYSYFANLLDLCGVAVPNATLPDGMPMGVTLLAPAWHDRALIGLARRFEASADETAFELKRSA
ncbi:allophanate hydrolase [Bradyrhizobium sp. WYCCWR 13023]|uniref:Allophanate hydrolase n=1 Tax=Bradyrhizobium zhengyangense TaxID=2911009 RepID=A0A9X1RDC2_9BRAD|nr:allophanate hydrolase [Bradyrhizobium sp. CCBAU 11434]MCG2629525.1 allophanate hydrolase [Bradyrhizobium zhengyangense]MCG2643858.1 allophanate hydrolase [Bradyrhizobium zhengyangense]MCG2671046.1 allophanate hydrolase [Bradyrhizobium zhengyangense]MDA9519450.1 amidase [Bradyrhizobium sp. CCBAU 11434]